MPSRPPAHLEPDAVPRSRHDLAQLADDAASSARRARTIAVAAIVVAALAAGLAAYRLLVPATATSCQSTAWNSTPPAADLPTGWSLTATQFDNDRATTTLIGPTSSDGSSQAIVYATATCFERDAAGAVSHAEDAAKAAGQTVAARTDLGDQGFGSTDDTGAAYVQFRHGSVVVSIAASGDATSSDVNAVASAYDRALGGDGAAAGTAQPAASGSAEPSSSAAPSASEGAAAPELEAALPKKVGTTELTIDSVLGPDLLGQDQASRAVSAALKAEGKSPDDLKVAQAYDPNGQLDLNMLAVTVNGMDRTAVRTFVIDTWLSASGAGVKHSQVTLAKRTFTKIDYGDGGTIEYVTQAGDVVIVIETSDPAVAEQAAAALP